MLRTIAYRLYERRLLAEVRQRPLPAHLGLIQDGHRRYAREVRLASLNEGYRLGATTTRRSSAGCAELKIPRVTLWWLSTENLARQPAEVGAVLQVIEEKMAAWTRGTLARRLGLRIRPIGKLELLPVSTLRALQAAESATRDQDRLLLNVAVGYGGRQEIIDAVSGYLRDCVMRGDPPDEMLRGLTAEALEKYLYTYDCPDPDLIIRTSGEVRLSGFMLWQSAYSEYYFCDAYWPAFRKIDFPGNPKLPTPPPEIREVGGGCGEDAKAGS